jgi:S1-C subfamily serine protease
VVPRLARGESIDRGYLGVETTDAPSGGGAEVASVVPGGPAERAGLQTGDLIVTIDGVDVRSLGGLLGEIERHSIGDSILLEVVRDGAPFQVTVPVEERPATVPAG